MVDYRKSRTGDVRIDVDGEEYCGSYWRQGKVVGVMFGTASKQTQLGGMAAEQIAKTLLRELVRDAAEK